MVQVLQNDIVCQDATGRSSVSSRFSSRVTSRCSNYSQISSSKVAVGYGGNKNIRKRPDSTNSEEKYVSTEAIVPLKNQLSILEVLQGMQHGDDNSYGRPSGSVRSEVTTVPMQEPWFVYSGASAGDKYSGDSSESNIAYRNESNSGTGTTPPREYIAQRHMGSGNAETRLEQYRRQLIADQYRGNAIEGKTNIYFDEFRDIRLPAAVPLFPDSSSLPQSSASAYMPRDRHEIEMEAAIERQDQKIRSLENEVTVLKQYLNMMMHNQEDAHYNMGATTGVDPAVLQAQRKVKSARFESVASQSPAAVSLREYDKMMSLNDTSPLIHDAHSWGPVPVVDTSISLPINSATRHRNIHHVDPLTVSQGRKSLKDTSLTTKSRQSRSTACCYRNCLFRHGVQLVSGDMLSSGTASTTRHQNCVHHIHADQHSNYTHSPSRHPALYTTQPPAYRLLISEIRSNFADDPHQVYDREQSGVPNHVLTEYGEELHHLYSDRPANAKAGLKLKLPQKTGTGIAVCSTRTATTAASSNHGTVLATTARGDDVAKNRSSAYDTTATAAGRLNVDGSISARQRQVHNNSHYMRRYTSNGGRASGAANAKAVSELSQWMPRREISEVSSSLRYAASARVKIQCKL
eukprot:Lankesteria_metandrocarpae@DN5467_c1_g1_i19.p1